MMGCCGKKNHTIIRNGDSISGRRVVKSKKIKTQKVRKPPKIAKRQIQSIKLKPVVKKPMPKEKVKCPGCGHPMRQMFAIGGKLMYQCASCDTIKKL
jgi:hypothetical protein